MLLNPLPTTRGLPAPSVAASLGTAGSQAAILSRRQVTKRAAVIASCNVAQGLNMAAADEIGAPDLNMAAQTTFLLDRQISNSKASTRAFTTPSAVIDVDPTQYETQLQHKLQQLKALFSGLPHPDIELHTSQPSHYRMRAEFSVWREKVADATGSLHYIMYDRANTAAPAPGSKRKAEPARVKIQQFPVGSQLINDLMPLVLSECQKDPLLSERLFQVNFFTTLSGQAMVTLLYHKKLDDAWTAAAKRLRSSLTVVLGMVAADADEQAHSTPNSEASACALSTANGNDDKCSTAVASSNSSGSQQDHAAACAAAQALTSSKRPMLHIIGRSRKQKVNLDQDWVLERMDVNGKEYVYKQVEGAFSQPNAGICRQMLAWAQAVTAGSARDLLELYCGNGNFTIPLAQNFKNVVATEVSKASVDAARFNLQANKVDNVFLARMASEEFTETWRVKGTRRRLQGLDWDTLDLQTILVDPPRAGLDNETVQLLKEFTNIVYISCNPETLRANLEHISDTHQIIRFAAFDQFPYTHHLECGVYLQKKT